MKTAETILRDRRADKGRISRLKIKIWQVIAQPRAERKKKLGQEWFLLMNKIDPRQAKKWIWIAARGATQSTHKDLSLNDKQSARVWLSKNTRDMETRWTLNHLRELNSHSRDWTKQNSSPSVNSMHSLCPFQLLSESSEDTSPALLSINRHLTL